MTDLKANYNLSSWLLSVLDTVTGGGQNPVLDMVTSGSTNLKKVLALVA